MGRSRWKLLYFSNSTWRKIFFLKNMEFLRSQSVFYDRSSSIPRCFNFWYIKIHKGKYYRTFIGYPLVIGKKLGEFSFTRKPYHFPLKKKKAKK